MSLGGFEIVGSSVFRNRSEGKLWRWAAQLSVLQRPAFVGLREGQMSLGLDVLELTVTVAFFSDLPLYFLASGFPTHSCVNCLREAQGKKQLLFHVHNLHGFLTFCGFLDIRAPLLATPTELVKMFPSAESDLHQTSGLSFRSVSCAISTCYMAGSCFSH